MTQQSAEERISTLEHEVAELKQQLQRVLAERRTFDDLRSEIRSVGRTVTEFSLREAAHEEYVAERFNNVETDVSVLIDAAKQHKEAIEQLHTGQQELRTSVQALQVGQDQILAILTGRAKTND